MKDLKNLEGAKMLSNNEQRAIKGGVFSCWSRIGEEFPKECPEDWYCDYPTCIYAPAI